MAKTKHYGDCSIYQTLDNCRPESGICTCGYGSDYLSENGGDTLHLYSNELKRLLESKIRPENIEASEELLNKIFGEKIKWHL